MVQPLAAGGDILKGSNRLRLAGSRPSTIPAAVLLAILLAFLFHPPRLVSMTHYLKGSYQWTRAMTYLQQVENPFRSDVEPAMRWRLLPPLVAHYLQLRGVISFLIPWAGIVALLAFVANVLKRRLPDGAYVLGCTVAIANTFAVLIPIHWYGMNDAWVWLALMVLAFSKSRKAILAACLLAPWIDERFLIGLPLAWIIRSFDREEPLLRQEILLCAPILIYLGARILGAFKGIGVESDFLAGQMREVIVYGRMVPLAWWMGLNACWVAILYGAATLSVRERWIAGLVFAATAGLTILLAADLSRSSAIVLPAILFGMLRFARFRPADAPKAALGLGLCALMLPLVNVVYNKTDPIDPIPYELIRLVRGPS